MALVFNSKNTIIHIAKLLKSRKYNYSLRNIIIHIDRLIGAKIFTSPFGFFEGSVGTTRLKINAIRAEKKYLETYNSSYQKGYDKFSNLLSDAGVKFYENLLSEAISSNSSLLTTVEKDNFILSQALSFKAGDEELKNFNKFFDNSKASKVLYGVLKGPFEIESVNIWRNHHLPLYLQNTSEDFYSAQWHTDGCATDLVKIFVNLHDVTLNHGPTILASRAESKQLIKLGYKKRQDYHTASIFSNKLELTPENIMSGKKGDGFYFTPARCMHRAGIPNEGLYRDMLMIVANPKLLK